MKVYDYILVFKSNGHRLINSISRMMLLLSVSVFLFTAFISFKKSAVLPILISAGIIAWWVYVYQKGKKGIPVFSRIALFLAAVGWYIQPGGLILSIIYLVAAVIEKQVKFPQEVAFDINEIVFNSLPKKRYSWTDINHIVLKDGLLTIDFSNNKLIQKELESFPTIKLEEEFNAFCKNRLSHPTNMQGS